MSRDRDDVLQAARQRRAALDLVPEHAPPAEGRPGLVQRAVRWAATVATVLLVAALTTGGMYWSSTLDDPFSRERAPEQELPASDLADYRAWAAGEPGTQAPIVLTYHDIQDEPSDSPYVVTSDQFARQMQMFAEAGYSTLSAEEFLAYLDGRFVPQGRTILITFDDGTAGLWRHADATLERHGFSAVSFLITSKVGTAAPYYLTWDLVRAMRDTGRWEFGSHTADLHVRVPSGPGGRLGGALTHRRWADGSLEPAAALHQRVEADLRLSIEHMASQGLPRPVLFSYPFSDVVAKNVDPVEAQRPREIVASLFRVAFVDVDPSPLPVSRREAQRDLIERAEVFAHDTERSLFDRLRDMDALPVSDLDPLTVDSHWLQYGGHPAPVEVRDGALVADARTERYVFGDWAPQRTSDWVDYTVSATLRGLSQPGVTAGLRVRTGGEGQLLVRVSDRSVSVVGYDGSLPEERSLAPGDSHVLVVTVLDGRTEVRVDGRLLIVRDGPSGPTARGGFGAVWSRESLATDFVELAGLRVSDGTP